MLQPVDERVGLGRGGGGRAIRVRGHGAGLCAFAAAKVAQSKPRSGPFQWATLPRKLSGHDRIVHPPSPRQRSPRPSRAALDAALDGCPPLSAADVDTIECAVGDFSSVARGKSVGRADFIALSGCRLPSVALGLTLTAGEPEAVFGPLLPASYLDVDLVPDLATLHAQPGRTRLRLGDLRADGPAARRALRPHALRERAVAARRAAPRAGAARRGGPRGDWSHRSSSCSSSIAARSTAA